MATIRAGHSLALQQYGTYKVPRRHTQTRSDWPPSDMDVPASLEHWRGADLIDITRLQHATAETRKHRAHVANG